MKTRTDRGRRIEIGVGLVEAIRHAGEILSNAQREGLDEIEKPGGSSTTDADRMAQLELVKYFAKEYPDFPILAEEELNGVAGLPPSVKLLQVADGTRLPDKYVSIDPADGTAFLANGSPEFAVSAAIIAGRLPVAGVVYQPRRRKLYAFPSTGRRLKPISINSKSLSQSLIGLDNCKAVTPDVRAAVIDPLVYGCRFPENLPSVASGIHLLQRITSVWVSTNARNWDVAATALLVQRAGGVTYQLMRRRGLWRFEEIPWNVVRMPPLLFAANQRLAEEALATLNGRDATDAGYRPSPSMALRTRGHFKRRRAGATTSARVSSKKPR